MTDAPNQIELFPIAEIVIGVRSREVNEDRAKTLAKQLETDPLLHPITLWQSKDGPTLIAGAHRLAAFKLNGNSHIPAVMTDVNNAVDAARLEAVENLAREELSAFDRAQTLYEWKRVYEAEHPEIKHGAQGGRSSQKNEKLTMSFSRYASARGAGSTATIKRYCKMWKDLCRKARIELEGSKFADRFADLKALSDIKSEVTQRKVLKLLFPRDASVKAASSVREALEILDCGKPISYVEKHLGVVSKYMKETSDKHFADLMYESRKRVLAWARENPDADKK